MPAFQLSAVAAALVSLIRHRTYTPASVAHDGKDHFHEWSEWQPATLKHGQAVTGPRNDPKVWDMVPLYTHPAPAQARLQEDKLEEIICAWFDCKNRSADDFQGRMRNALQIAADAWGVDLAEGA